MAASGSAGIGDMQTSFHPGTDNMQEVSRQLVYGGNQITTTTIQSIETFQSFMRNRISTVANLEDYHSKDVSNESIQSTIDNYEIIYEGVVDVMKSGEQIMLERMGVKVNWTDKSWTREDNESRKYQLDEEIMEVSKGENNKGSGSKGKKRRMRSVSRARRSQTEVPRHQEQTQQYRTEDEAQVDTSWIPTTSAEGKGIQSNLENIHATEDQNVGQREEQDNKGGKGKRADAGYTYEEGKWVIDEQGRDLYLAPAEERTRPKGGSKGNGDPSSVCVIGVKPEGRYKTEQSIMDELHDSTGMYDELEGGACVREKSSYRIAKCINLKFWTMDAAERFMDEVNDASKEGIFLGGNERVRAFTAKHSVNVGEWTNADEENFAPLLRPRPVEFLKACPEFVMRVDEGEVLLGRKGGCKFCWEGDHNPYRVWDCPLYRVNATFEDRAVYQCEFCRLVDSHSSHVCQYGANARRRHMGAQ
jgi:uncharacterized protein YeeX (DUF496 family)